jgi:hypothetical protein
MGISGIPAIPRPASATQQKFGFNPTTNTGVGQIPRAPSAPIARPTDEIPPLERAPSTPAIPRANITAEIPSGPAERLGAASVLPTGEIEPVAKRVRQDIATPPPMPALAPPAPSKEIPIFEVPPPEPVAEVTPDLRRGTKLPWILGGIVVLGGLGFVGWQIYDVMKTDDTTPAVPVAKAPADAAVASDAAKVATAPIDAGKAIDAGKVAATPIDAAVKVAVVVDAAVPIDAAVKIATPVPPPQSGDGLYIDSNPHGARVFLDGKDVGETPIKLAAMPAKHNVALVLAAHDLYVASMDGHGTFTVPLTAVPPWKGNAGIKLLKCTGKDRYYVYVDGKPTGMTCPTERINTSMGPHTVEVYDAQTDTKKKWDITVPDERLSVRVRVEP